MIRLIRPIRFGPAVEVFLAVVDGRRCVARRYPCGEPPAGWPPAPDPEVLRTINHRGIQRFLREVEDDTGARVQVFAWVPGRTLAEVLATDRAPLPIESCWVLLHRGALGLQWLHQRCPVAPRLHGDVSPANLLWARNGRVVWLDCLALQPGVLPGGPGVVFGTVTYLAPEVLAGEPPTPASEVFSFGLVILEALRGPLPWRGARGPGEVLRAMSGRASPRRLIEGIPSPLAEVLASMMQDDARNRPAAAQVVRWARARRCPRRRPRNPDHLCSSSRSCS